MAFVSEPTYLIRLTDAAYENGVNFTRGCGDPVEIAQVLFDQDGDMPDPMGLSELFVTWGQFVDHDLSHTPDASGELIFVDGLVGPLNRSVYDPQSEIDGVREQLNMITPSIDGSMVYGSNELRAEQVRAFEGGRLLVSEDPNSDHGLLPFSYPGAGMAGDAQGPMFLAGDVRANENTGLTMLHTVFVREHNYWAERLASENPEWTDQQLYDGARSIVEFEVQKVTYEDWLPKLIGDALDEYDGYDPDADARVSNEFSTTAFRFGHTMVSSVLERLNEDGTEADVGNLTVAEAFFNPDPFLESSLDGLLRGQATATAQAFDTQMIDDMNFFLETPGGVTGFSLAALNILRGRDHGLDTYINVRAQLIGDIDTDDIDPLDFSVITSDVEVQARLAEVYDSVHHVDLWVGGLAEDKIPGTQTGVVFTYILADQFTRTRAADASWADLNPALGEEILNELGATTLSDIMLRNSDVEYFQADSFVSVARVYGTEDSDRLVGTGESNLIMGLGSRDVLLGRMGEDTIFGGAGNDVLRGNRGDDMLDGGAGNDKMFGSRDSDTFVFAKDYDRDRIMDFNEDLDNIRIVGFGITEFDDLMDLAREKKGNVEFNFGDGDKLTLMKIDIDDLSADHFDFFA